MPESAGAPQGRNQSATAHTQAAEPEPPAAPTTSRGVLVALIGSQVGLHGAMTGLRMAAPLQALDDGHSAWRVGVLLALFAAAPVLTALATGRMTDRHGYHRPARLAGIVTVLGILFAVGATWLDGLARFGALAIAACLVGAGANVVMIAVQRTAGAAARNSVERVRLFSWLGLAPAMANVIGPVTLGFVIDLAGFRAAYATALVMPAAAWWCMRRVPRSARPVPARGQGGQTRRSLELLAAPGVRRLLVVNWLLSTCWDVHAFAVPILGHGLGYGAATIGLVLGSFTLSVTGVRLVVPMLAHRVREVAVIRGAMLGTALVFAAYPFAGSPWTMGLCAVLLGLTLGSVQPMVMSTLHRLTPEDRHGEAIAFRTMAINASSTVMPLVFGATGAVVGAAALFWIVALAVGGGNVIARGLEPTAR